jgi:hypothetical protein
VEGQNRQVETDRGEQGRFGDGVDEVGPGLVASRSTNRSPNWQASR